MQTVLVLTISGADRAGLVEQLAKVVAEHDGNWEHCRMAHLAERFVGLLQITVPSDRQQDLEAALRTIEDLDVMIAAGESVVRAEPMRQFDLEVIGSDHPGIVRDVFEALATVGVNVEELGTRTYSAPDSGGILFEATARLESPATLDHHEVREQLERIAQDIMVEIRLKD